MGIIDLAHVERVKNMAISTSSSSNTASGHIEVQVYLEVKLVE